MNKNLDDKKKYEELKEQYLKNRTLPIFICGEAPQVGNRKFNFDFENNKLVYKSKVKKKIEIEFVCSKKQNKNLVKVQELCNKRQIPVTIRLSTEFVYVVFDESCLNGYRLEKKLFIKGNKEHNKKVYRDLEELKLKYKKRNRYISVDLNPQYIGLSICDREEDEVKIVKTVCYDLSKLSSKLKLSSTDKKQIYQNNKRRFEISQVWKSIFNIAVNYKVGYFVLEELNFKENVLNDSAKESNRKCRNIWHRGITNGLINKYCNILGIQKIEINPCYSSFIGNVQNRYFDPVSASIEICRRGIYKFEKNRFYPKLKKSDFDTMSNLIEDQVRDVEGLRVLLLEKLFECKTWVALFKIFKQAKLRYRRSLDFLKFEEFSLNNKKSLVSLYTF
jgi:IS605 OrfB family transposase